MEKIEIDGDYGTRQCPTERVVLYCVDAPGKYPVHGRGRVAPKSWDEYGRSISDGLESPFDLVPLKSKPITKPSCNWGHIADDWNAMAKDKNGRIWFYGEVSGREFDTWNGTRPVSMKALASLDPGTCDWEDSLVRRPT